MKRGGQVIYGGKLGERSKTMVDYFQVTLHSLYCFKYVFFTLIIFVFVTMFEALVG